MYQQDHATYQSAITLDGAEFKRLHPIGPVGIAAVITFAVTTITYFAYRLPLWNPAAPIMSGLLLAAEIFGVMTVALHVFSTWSLVERRAPPVPAGFEADIFITTWNESREILRHTLLAAKQVKHARAIWLLDDGCREEMEELARELDVRYIARVDRSHAKAGNLNNALQYSDAPFIAIFDCDHAPSPEFLERTLGYFLNPRVAFVQTPQDFYNVDSFQHRGSAETREAWHEQTLFYRVIQAGKDRWNATFFCGSCAIMRRTALEDIGGFATGTITEDMHTSLRMHKNGWEALYHAEALAFGLSPVNLEQYETQRLRWGRGAMQVWAKEGILFRGKLTLAQRLAYFTSAVTYFEGWQKAIVYFLPMVVLLTGSMPIIWTGWPFVLIFTLWLLSGLIVNEVFSRGYAKTMWMEEYNFLRFFTFMKATMALVIPIKWRFSVTPKGMNSDFRVAFPLPVVARLTLSVDGESQNVLAIAEDISSDGLNLAVDSRLALEGKIEGTLLLPTGPAPFCGSILRTIQPKGASTKMVGVKFEWVDGGDGDALNSCLYGNTLQWDVNSWAEVRKFNLARFLPAWLGGNEEESRIWKMARLRAGDQAIDCLVRKEGQTFRILSYSSLPATADLRLRVAHGDSQAGLQVTGYREYVIGGASVHLAILAKEQLNAAGFHREPSWTRA